MNANTRQLIHVPILHSPADMGTIGGRVEAAYVELFGRQQWREHLVQLGHFWQAVATAVDGLGLDYARVDLYQDSLPVCGKEIAIVRDAARDSDNYRLLLRLAAQGARLIGTEDPQLLLEEYRSIQMPPTTGATPVTAGAAERACLLLAKRDIYIAARIDRILQPGRIGLLFLGMLHDIRQYLPANIVVRCLEVLKPVPSQQRSP